MPTTLGRHNPLLKHVRKLAHDTSYRREHGQFVAEGARVVEAALLAGFPLDTALVRPGLELDFPATTTVYEVEPAVLERIAPAETSQGVLVVARIPQHRVETDLVLVLVGLQDPGNVGTLLRSARAVAPCGVICSGGVDPWSPKVVRSSAGAIFSLPIERREVTPRDFADHAVFRAVVRGGEAPRGLRWPARTALALGSEARGLGPEWDAARGVTIPMAPGCESLNVAMAGTLLLFDYREVNIATGRRSEGTLRETPD